MFGHVSRSVWAISLLVAVAATGFGILFWLGDLQGDGELNSTYVLIRGIADWMVKASIGGVLGFAIGRLSTDGKAEGKRFTS